MPQLQPRASLVFVTAVTAYFAVQIGLRLWLGGALETDEAEMMVMTPGLRWGYGPQLPLYNWLQVALFDLFGRNLFALSLLKNMLLCATYLLIFIGLRLFLPVGVAAAGALSLYLIPDVAWEAQRATTHSNMLLFTSAATLAAFLWVLKSGRWAAYGALGLAIGLGGLAKYNFWLVPIGLIAAALTLPAFRARVLSSRMGAALGLAVLVVAGPYVWMLRNPGLAFSSTGKLAMGNAPGFAEQALGGLGQLLAGVAVLSILALIVGAVAWAVGRGRAATPQPPVAALLLRAGLIILALMAVGVVAAGVGKITPRWLLPLVFLAVPGGAVWLGARLRPRGGVVFAAIVAVLALAVLTGLGFDRFKDRARRAVDFVPLPAVLADVAPLPDTPVVAEFFTAGNLARLRPDWRVAPYLPFAARDFGGGPVLFVLRENTPETLAAGLRQAGWGDLADPRILAQGAFTLTFTTSDKAMKMRYYLVEAPGVGGDG